MSSPFTINLPNELLVEVISHLCLKSLIAGRTVSRGWKELIRIAPLNRTRRRLLLLYKRILRSPWFEASRAWPSRNLSYLERQAYIDRMYEQHCEIPEEFEMWILEWPERVTIACLWPGLPNEWVHDFTLPLDQWEGCNALANLPPIVRVVTFNVADPGSFHSDAPSSPDPDPSDEEFGDEVVNRYYPGDNFLFPSPPEDLRELPALLVHWDWQENIWLILASQRPIQHQVYALVGAKYSGAHDEQCSRVFPGWIEFLYSRVRDIDKRWKKKYPGSGGTPYGETPVVPDAPEAFICSASHQTARASLAVSNTASQLNFG